MAVATGVGRSQHDGQIGAWNAEAVIAATVDPHKDPFDHVAALALSTRRAGIMKVMPGRVVVFQR